MVRGDLVGKGCSNVHCGVQSGTTAIIYKVEPTVLFFLINKIIWCNGQVMVHADTVGMCILSQVVRYTWGILVTPIDLTQGMGGGSEGLL